MSESTVPSLPGGFYPFWFWNARLEEAEVRRQVAEMARGGVRGFFIHPRQGLRQPYLSEAFFRMMDVAVEEAEGHGLTVHLYDEYPYPSGVAGGEVILGNPQFHATTLHQESADVPGGPVTLPLPRGKILNCTAVPMDGDRLDWSSTIDCLPFVGMTLTDDSYVETGLTSYNRKRYFADKPTPVLDMDLPERPHRIFFSAQVTVSNHKYWSHFADVMNPDAVREFIRLTHERYAARYAGKFGQTIASIFVDETAPRWSECVPEAFAHQHGYDLLTCLPAMQEPGHPNHSQVRADYEQTLLSVFCRSFDEPIAAWCHAHGIRYSAEKNNYRMSQFRYADLPGGDPGHTKAGAPLDLLQPQLRQNARAIASAAYFYGKEGGLAECYHSLGWSGTLQDIKLMADGLLLLGIPYLVPHAFYYSSHALRKHDGPPSFFFQMPYWPLFRDLTEHVDAVLTHFGDTWIDARVLIVEPSSGLPSPEQRETYAALLHSLMAKRVDFLMADTDILEAGTAADGAVTIRDIRADLVVVPPMSHLEAPLTEWLSGFEAAGGTVLRVAPDEDAGAVASRITELAPSRVPIHVLAGPEDRVWTVTRTDGSRRLWFVLNTSREPAEIEIDEGVAVRHAPPAPAAQASGTRTLRPFESFILAASAPSDSPAAAPVRVTVTGDAALTPLHKNLLRLYDWEMTLTAADGDSQTANVPAIPLSNQLSVGGFRFCPDTEIVFGMSPEFSLPTLDVRYRCAVEVETDTAVELVMEPDSILGEWSIEVNGERVPQPSDFHPSDVLVAGTLSADITSALHPGRNTIEVGVRTDRHDGGLRNALYLAGTFGVRLDPPALVAPVQEGEFDAWDENLMPHYAGVLEYATDVTVESLPEADRVAVELELGRPCDDACEVSINGGDWLPVPWSPRVVTVKRNVLKVGRNRLRLRQYTTLIRAFEGQYFDIADHVTRTIGSA